MTLLLLLTFQILGPNEATIHAGQVIIMISDFYIID